MVYLTDVLMQGVLDTVYNNLIANCGELTGVSSAIAGFRYPVVCSRAYLGRYCRGQGVNLRPLYRPFLIGLAILLYPYVIGILNGILSPTVTSTAAIAGDANQAVATLLQEKQQALQNSTDWQMYAGRQAVGVSTNGSSCPGRQIPGSSPGCPTG
jgi:hypothetical protein